MLRSLYISSKRASVSVPLFSDLFQPGDPQGQTYSLFPSSPRPVSDHPRVVVTAGSARQDPRSGVESKFLNCYCPVVPLALSLLKWMLRRWWGVCSAEDGKGYDGRGSPCYSRVALLMMLWIWKPSHTH